MEQQTILAQINTFTKWAGVTVFSLFAFSAAVYAASTGLEVEVAEVGAHSQPKTREFVGIVNLGGLIDISAPMAGIVTEFKDKPGMTVKASERLAAIKNLDELYQDVVIKSPSNNIRIMRTFVEEGNYVQKHQRMMVLARDIYYEAKVHLIASEVGWLKEASNIEVRVHPNTPHEQAFGIVESRIEIPDQQSRFYNARLKLACPQSRCEETAMAGAIVKVLVKSTGNIMISKDALLNEGSTVAVVDEHNVIKHRQIVKGQVKGDVIEVLHGLKRDERVVVRYSHVPKEGEKAQVKATLVEQFAVLETAANFE